MKLKYNKYSDFEVMELAETQLKKEVSGYIRTEYNCLDILAYADKIKSYLNKETAKVCC